MKDMLKLNEVLNVELKDNAANVFLSNYYGLRYKKYHNASKNIVNNILIQNSIIDTETNNLNMYSDFVESSRLIKRTQGVGLPVRLIKYPFGLQFTDAYHDVTDTNHSTDLFRFRFNDGESKIQHKILPHTTYLTLKQKRYKRRKVIPSQVKFYHDETGIKTKQVRYSGKPILFNNVIFEDNITDPTILYRMIKKNKKRIDITSVTLAKRLLRVKKTLVLPAHVNITVITNSYDIVHS
jgi:hypothetical protein